MPAVEGRKRKLPDSRDFEALRRERDVPYTRASASDEAPWVEPPDRQEELAKATGGQDRRAGQNFSEQRSHSDLNHVRIRDCTTFDAIQAVRSISRILISGANCWGRFCWSPRLVIEGRLGSLCK